MEMSAEYHPVTAWHPKRSSPILRPNVIGGYCIVIHDGNTLEPIMQYVDHIGYPLSIVIIGVIHGYYPSVMI